MNPNVERAITYARAMVAVLHAFDTLEQRAGWFERLQLRLLRTTYQQRLRYLMVSLPSELSDKILKGEVDRATRK